MQNSIKRPLVLFLLLLTFLPLTPSVKGEWSDVVYDVKEGTDIYGIRPLDPDCALEITHTTLTYNIFDLPKESYSSDKELSEYSATVTVSHSISNPTENDITATLCFPLGVYPQYASDADEDVFCSEYLSRYGITVDGEKADITVRHTYMNTSIAEQLARLRSDYRSDTIYSANTKVTVYNYKVTDTEAECYGVLILPYKAHSSSRVIVAPTTYSRAESDLLYFGARINEAEGDNTFSVYCIGEPLNDTVNSVVYSGQHSQNQVSGTVTLESTETITLEELIMTNYTAESSISEDDWYDAIIDYILADWKNGPLPASVGRLKLPNKYFMRWYLYDITVPAGETVTSEISAPVYPDINLSIKPYVYKYYYSAISSSLQSDDWTLDVEVVTPYYMTDVFGCLTDYEKTENGYRLSTDSSSGQFELSTDPEPIDMAEKRHNAGFTIAFIGLCVVMLIFVGIMITPIIFLIVVIVKWIRKRRSKGG